MLSFHNICKDVTLAARKMLSSDVALLFLISSALDVRPQREGSAVLSPRAFHSASRFLVDPLTNLCIARNNNGLLLRVHGML